MNKAQQIEEMAQIIGHCESTLHPVIKCHDKSTGCYCIENPCHNQRLAEKLYNAGYSKQSENVVELPCKVGTTLYFLYNSSYADKPDLTPRIYKTTDWYFEIDKTGIAINTKMDTQLQQKIRLLFRRNGIPHKKGS